MNRRQFLGTAAALSAASPSAPAAAVGLAQDSATALGDDIIKRTRSSALAYIDNLHNFICTQVNRKFSDDSGDGSAWRQTAETVAEVRFVDKVESYRTITVNGRPSNKNFRQVGAGNVSGEFGRTLFNLFRPESEAVFRCSGNAVLGGRDVHVFRVEVPKHRYSGILFLGFDTFGKKMWPVNVGYKGLIYRERDGQSPASRRQGEAGHPARVSRPAILLSSRLRLHADRPKYVPAARGGTVCLSHVQTALSPTRRHRVVRLPQVRRRVDACFRGSDRQV